MIQFSKPRRTLVKAMDQFRRHETSARDYMNNGAMGDGTFSLILSICFPIHSLYFISTAFGHTESLRCQLLPHA